ncbi:MAG: hypothetical protein R2818_14965 [Flavobacteriales bacterium]
MKLSASTKAFLIVLASIVLLFVLADRFHFRSDPEEVRRSVIELDTAAVVAIHSTSQADPERDLHLFRSGGAWRYGNADSSSITAQNKALELLRTFQQLRVKRRMGSLLEFGDRFDLRSNTTRTLSFVDFDGKENSLNIGSSTFGQGKGIVWTYVHVPMDTKVYAVEADLFDLIRSEAQ